MTGVEKRQSTLVVTFFPVCGCVGADVAMWLWGCGFTDLGFLVRVCSCRCQGARVSPCPGNCECQVSLHPTVEGCGKMAPVLRIHGSSALQAPRLGVRQKIVCRTGFGMD